MASRYSSKGFKRNALTAALGLCFVGGLNAQTNTAGAVAGKAASGDTITVTSPSTGLTRTITVSGDGSYRISALPIGEYTVTRTAADGTTSTRAARVNVGTAANVDFVSGAATSSGGGATTLD
ncbi:MAG: carboxypeptidase-like regulatory domain-containing protein, partial [Pseudoxanthomonas sp.]